MFAGVLATYLATTGGSMATDSMSYEVAKSLFESRSVAMSRNVHDMDAHRGVDGRYYSPYGIGHPLFAVPFYALGRLAETRLGVSVGRPEAVRKAAFVAGNAVAAALAVWIVVLFAWRLSGHLRAAVWTGMAVAFGSLLWPYAKFGFNAPVAALAVVAGLYACWTGVRSDRGGLVVAGGLALAGALLVRHELALVGVIVGLWAVVELDRNWRPIARVWLAIGVPIAIATLLTLYYDDVRFGSPWDTGNLRDATATFGAPWNGVAGLLVSPGRSVFLYSLVTLPGVLAFARLFRQDRSTAWLLGGVSVVLFLFYASLTYWDADRSYGPRYLLPIVPLLCLPLALTYAAADAGTRRRLALVLALSALLQLPGVLVDFTKAGPALGVRHPLEERRWNWRVASMNVNTQAIIRFAPDNLRYLAGVATPPSVRPPEGLATDFSEQFGYSLDFWWLYLFYMGRVPAWLAVAAGGAAMLAAVFCFRRAAANRVS